MMNNKLSFIGLHFIFSVGLYLNADAQSTFTRVTQILQNNCTAASCHGANDTKVFDISGSQQDVYDAIVNVEAENATANGKGNKLVAPGYPQRSFLLRKIANGISSELSLESSEGDACPKNAAALTNAEIELVRQWIMFGSSQTGVVVYEQTLVDFYSGKALPELQAPPAPPVGQGFQLHDGPIFLTPGEEREFQWKFKTETGAVEVARVEAFLCPQSHHYILHKYLPGQGAGAREGHRIVDTILDQVDAFFKATMVATWQYNRNHELPEGTAYYWEAGADLISNFHVRNYDDDSILAAHVYMNVYTRPQGSGAVEMFSALASYGGFNPMSLNIPNSGVNEVLSFPQTEPETWHIWIMQAHTHKLGKDYDIFLGNSNGSKGDQIYEGWFDYEQGFNKGYYDFAHPPVLEFSPLMTVDMSKGLVHEATYFNDGSSDVGFGLTTADEMFITYMHYTKALPTGIRDLKSSGGMMSVYPNPSNGQFTVSYELSKTEHVKMELFNTFGGRAALLKDEMQTKRAYNESYDATMLELSPGIYFIRVRTSNFSNIAKLLVE